MIRKIYGAATGAGDERRYSPAVCTGIDKRVITGNPDKRKVSTGYVEPQNLTMRMGSGASPGSPTASPRRSRTSLTPPRCTTCTTTSPGRTRRSPRRRAGTRRPPPCDRSR